ncbi:MAG: ParB/RepB/Spo0J family partition protein [Nitrospirae bacterium]|nr:ParB/RepB/Spo0J family partition protein [Candidatus Troglogloeales bacterium]MBI3598946.1 ParB/RepB/Spo0J family partition protein [Candidatus Troglogloeales bacterium]
MQRKALGQGMTSQTDGIRKAGLGLAALMPPAKSPINPSQNGVEAGPMQIDIDKIIPNRYQPRENFDKEGLEALAKSIKKHGLIQPIVVRSHADGKFQLIAGERRMRAASIAGFSKMPAIVKDVDDKTSMEYALLENIQREELNPIEQAKGFSRLISEFSLTQEMIAERIGIDRSSVANTVRLLHLPESLWEEIAKGIISMGHAKALLSLPTKALQIKVAEEIKSKALSVRQVEAVIKSIVKKGRPRQKRGVENLSLEVKDLENRLQQALHTKVHIAPSGAWKTKGEIKIEYYSLDDLDRILEQLMK